MMDEAEVKYDFDSDFHSLLNYRKITSYLGVEGTLANERLYNIL